MDRWEGRVVLVTGASAGIGAAICKNLVQYGMKVVGAARKTDMIKNLASELKDEKGSLLPIKCDLTKDQDVYALFDTIKKTYGGVDICVNNAGMSSDTTLLDGTPEQWRYMMDLNVIALCLCNKLAIASMRERDVDDGHIINISSMAAHRVYDSMAMFHFYSGTKFAVKAISEGLRQELRAAQSYIRVSLISPGVVDTSFFEKLFDQETKQKMVSSFKFLTPEDLALIVQNVISSPGHVQVNDILVQPIEQP